MEINITYMILLVMNMLLSLSFFILAVVYFFLEARQRTMDINGKTLAITGLIAVCGLAVVVMTRYFIEFPQMEAYDMGSRFNFVIGIAQVILGFFIHICYIRCGESFTRQRGLPGSLYLKGISLRGSMDWRLILIPLPFLIGWTFLWFNIFTPEPTELIRAATPQDDSPITWLYLLLSVSVLAPIQEEILYRHFTMGILYRWFGRSPAAVAVNIFLTTLLFSLAHMAILTDDWIKILQIVPAGLIFGYVYHKKGLEHSILSHALFNTLVIPISYIVELLAA